MYRSVASCKESATELAPTSIIAQRIFYGGLPKTQQGRQDCRLRGLSPRWTPTARKALCREAAGKGIVLQGRQQGEPSNDMCTGMSQSPAREGRDRAPHQ